MTSLSFCQNCRVATGATMLRFRVVMMMTLSFILGVIPLLIATGARSESQEGIGTAGFGGMMAATFLGLVVVEILDDAVQTAGEQVWGGAPSK